MVFHDTKSKCFETLVPNFFTVSNFIYILSRNLKLINNWVLCQIIHDQHLWVQNCSYNYILAQKSYSDNFFILFYINKCKSAFLQDTYRPLISPNSLNTFTEDWKCTYRTPYFPFWLVSLNQFDVISHSIYSYLASLSKTDKVVARESLHADDDIRGLHYLFRFWVFQRFDKEHMVS